MTRLLALLITCLGLAGCLNGPHYWTRGDASAPVFLVDHQACFDAAYIGYGAGSEAAYKNCMVSKGWTRIQGRGPVAPDVPHFRGPEGDDEFTPRARQEWTHADPCQRWSIGLDRDQPEPKNCPRR